MSAISNFGSWLFNTRAGVLCLILGGVLFFLALSFFLERRTRKEFYNHEKSEDDWDLFDDED